MGCIESSSSSKSLPQVQVAVIGLESSGKSTIIKQIRSVHGVAFSVTELENYKRILYYNLLEGVKRFVQDNGLGNNKSIKEQKHKDFVARLGNFRSEQEISSTHLAKKVYGLLHDPNVAKHVKRKKAGQDSENNNFGYLTNNLYRLMDPSFVPNIEDILHARQRTTGLVSTVLQTRTPKCSWHFVDGGGGYTERRKWQHALKEAKAVMFCVSLSEFDVYRENAEKPLLEESRELFRSMLDDHYFEQKIVILFFTKIDLFKSKLEDMSAIYRNYTGTTYDEAIQFLANRFTKGLKQPVNIYDICAFDTEHLRGVLKEVTSTIIKHKPAVPRVLVL